MTTKLPITLMTYSPLSSSGTYRWDNGDVVFSDPDTTRLKQETKRKRPRKRGKKLGSGSTDNSKHFHRKHG